MTTTNILSLLGGLALFLYGMQMMGNGLEAAAGDRLKQILEKLTSNRFLGVIVGALVTAVIQSLFPELMHVLIMATEETATTSKKNGPIATVTT